MKVLHAVVCGICLLWLAGRDDMTSDGCLGFVCLLLLFVLFWGFLWGFLFFLFLEGGGGLNHMYVVFMTITCVDE